MYIQNLKLENFRNYISQQIKFINGINLFIGNNAQGKTNIIEAIYLCAFSKSYRAIKDLNMINFNKDYSRVSIDFIKKGSSRSAEIFLDKNNKKSIKQDGVKVIKNSDIIGDVCIVIFTPDDLDIVKGSPSSRRKFLDSICCQISKSYMINLQEYNKCLKIKNSFLKQEITVSEKEYVYILNEKMSIYIEKIVGFRVRVLNELLSKAKIIQKDITFGTEEISLNYVSDFINLSKEQILDTLNNFLNIEIIRKTSLKGIQRDDFEIFVNDFKVEDFGSQGQKRTCLLSLKLANFEVLKEVKGENPILLLDDIMSELDSTRVRFLLKYIENYQSVITTTDDNFSDEVQNIKVNEICNRSLENRVKFVV